MLRLAPGTGAFRLAPPSMPCIVSRGHRRCQAAHHLENQLQEHEALCACPMCGSICNAKLKSLLLTWDTLPDDGSAAVSKCRLAPPFAPVSTALTCTTAQTMNF